MSVYRRLAALAGAVTLLLLTPAAAEAQHRPGRGGWNHRPAPTTTRFAALAIPRYVAVYCPPGSNQGTAFQPVRVKVTSSIPWWAAFVTGDSIGDTLGEATGFVASYPGGSVELSHGDWGTINPRRGDFTFPCPASDGQWPGWATSQFPITVQGYGPDGPVGTPARTVVTLIRVGFSS